MGAEAAREIGDGKQRTERSEAKIWEVKKRNRVETAGWTPQLGEAPRLAAGVRPG